MPPVIRVGRSSSPRKNRPENCIIQAARLNGQPWNFDQLPHDILVKGGTLELELGPKPNEAWGVE